MSTGNIVAIVSVGVGVIAIAAGVLAARAWGNRRARLLVDHRSIKLLPSSDATRLIKVSYRDFEIPDPYLVTFRIKNTGPRDITSGHFDASRPLRIELGCKSYGLISPPANGTNVRISVSAIGAAAFVEVAPTLIKRGDGWVIELITDGHPVPTIDSPLIDTDIVEGEAYSSTVAKEAANSLLGMSLGGGVVSALIGLGAGAGSSLASLSGRGRKG